MDLYVSLAPDFDCPPGHPGRPVFDYQPVALADDPVVSVVTACYNCAPLFAETEASVFAQSLQQWEWVIVDDGSTDRETLDILARVQSRDPRVRVLRIEQNQGPAAARNLGVEQSRGRYVFFLDADDLIEPGTLEKLIWHLVSYPEYAFAKGSSTAFGGQEYHATVSFQAGNLFLNRNPVTISVMIQRSVLLEVGGFDVSLVHGLEDWDLWLRLAEHGYLGHGVPEFLDWYRRRRDHSDRWQSWTKEGMSNMRVTLRRRYPHVFRQGIPVRGIRGQLPYEDVPTELPFGNPLKKRKQRLLFIAPWMAMGGADQFNLNFLSQWSARGNEFSVVTTLDRNYPWYSEYTKLTPDVFILPHFLREVDYPRFLDYLLASRGYDVVLVSNSELGYKMLPYLRSRHPGVTYVDYSHMEQIDWNGGGFPRLGVGYQSTLDLNIVASKHLKSWMQDAGANEDQVEVAYIDVDTRRFCPDPDLRQRIRTGMRVSNETSVLIYAGRICAQKQPRVFARVMKELVAAGHNFVCLVLGDGEDRRWLARYIRWNRLGGHVRMLGAVPNAKMKEFLAAGDILFLPSKMEGISLAIYEAMAMGLAIVGADVGGQKELVTSACGTLIERGTPEEEVTRYAEVLAHLIEDHEVRRAMGTSARQRVEAHFTLEQMGDRMCDLLGQARALHDDRPKTVVSQALAREHITLGLEESRLNREIQVFAKYRALESIRWRVQAAANLLTERLRLRSCVALGSRLLRPIKDSLWVLGHRIKVALGLARNWG